MQQRRGWFAFGLPFGKKGDPQADRGQPSYPGASSLVFGLDIWALLRLVAALRYGPAREIYLIHSSKLSPQT
jgi:hypothetical protein